jgi:GDP-4-dehydro-6-deoxy-D-mannose reductase
MRVLMTGGAGFVGRHLAALLVEKGWLVWSLDRRHGGAPGTTKIESDLLDPRLVESAVKQARPRLVFHLAGRTPANSADSTASDWLSGDPVATHNLLEAVRLQAPDARVLVVSSSAVYGNALIQPISEACPLRPTTLYGVTKATVELVAQRFHTTHEMFVVRARAFNLLGAQVARIRSGASEPVLRLRHRATARDYLDVRDAARAYFGLLEQGAAGGVYNVCSGRATGIGVLADRLLHLADVWARIEETAPEPLPGDVVTQAGDPGALAATTGWRPEIPLDQSLRDLLASLA